MPILCVTSRASHRVSGMMVFVLLVGGTSSCGICTIALAGRVTCPSAFRWPCACRCLNVCLGVPCNGERTSHVERWPIRSTQPQVHVQCLGPELRDTITSSPSRCPPRSPTHSCHRVQNIDEKLKELALKKKLTKLFQGCGKIVQIVAMKSYARRGQAFVVFDTVEAASAALALQGYVSRPCRTRRRR